MSRFHVVRIPEFRGAAGPDAPAADAPRLAEWLQRNAPIAVLTGAGCSTTSGIPAYRDGTGRWQRRQPIFYQHFIDSDVVRRRYWARSFFGWTVMRDARPNPAHRSLQRLAERGLVADLVTQNVDGLHQAAGHGDVVELHGGLSRVICRDCGAVSRRDELQERLAALNPDWAPEVRGIRPDGDAELDEQAYPGFRVADCADCGGVLKPDVVFFGESVPRARLADCDARLREAGALLVVGSSLVVWSGFRMVRDAHARGMPVAAINAGRTRGDALLEFKVAGECGAALEAVERELPMGKAQASGS